MGAARRLQAEIDRTLKKVQEGMHEFDQIWEKVYDTENANQREKYEGDLKKEIKKLQRLRDQIKNWITNSDIKDKTALVDTRKAIEREMERFKVCEKEAKTKTYSKAGLGQAAKVDPEEKAKQEQREWLNEQVESLKLQVDEFESELESLYTAAKKGKKSPDRKNHLEDSVARHKQHITRLEQVMRCLDNETVNAEDVGDIKEMVEWYVDQNQEDFDSFAVADECYDPLLDRLNAVVISAPATGAPVKKGKDKDRPTGDDDRDKERDRERVAAKPSVSMPIPVPKVGGSSVEDEEDKADAQARATAAPLSTSASASLANSTAAQLNAVGNNTANTAAKVAGNQSTVLAKEDSGPATASAASKKKTWQTAPVLHSSVSPPVAMPESENGTAHAPAVTAGNDQEMAYLASPASQAPQGTPPMKIPAPNQAKAQPESNAAFSAGTSGAVSFASAAAGARTAGPPPVAVPPPQASQPVWGLGTADDSAFPELGAALERRPSRTEQGPADQKRILTRLQHMDINSSSQPSAVPSSTSPGPQTGPLVSQTNVPGPSQTNANQPGGLSYNANVPGSDPTQGQTTGAAAPSASQVPLQQTGPLGQALPPSTGQAPAQPQDFLEGSHLAGIVDLNQLIHELSLDGTRPEGGGVVAAPGQYENNPAQSLQTLQACCRRSMPQPGDSDYKTDLSNHANRVTPHLPASYPIHRLPQLDDGNFFQKIDQEALFFAFYYQPGSTQQFLAARELKRQAWRYNKEHKAWFQRSGEPKATTKDYEQGSYVYFDKTFSPGSSDNPADVNGWCYRKKDNFTFRYDQLEDELQ
eukprot:evm.model.scf_310.3 EVM.evm.TU.scf_310.3   scf_310:9187-17505(+)